MVSLLHRATINKCANVRVALKTFVKAVLNVSVSTISNNERQSFAKLSHSMIDNVLTNLLPAGLQDFFEVLNISNATTMVNKLLELGMLPRSNSPLALSLGYLAANARINALSSLVNGCIFIFTSTTSVMTSHRILFTTEYLSASFFYVFLFVYALLVLKALFYANFLKLG